MTLADRRPLTNAYEPSLPAVRRRSICGAGLGFGPQSSQTGSHLQTDLQRDMAGKVGRLLEIARIVHPTAELELQRFDTLRQEVEKCCPVESPPPITALAVFSFP